VDKKKNKKLIQIFPTNLEHGAWRLRIGLGETKKFLPQIENNISKNCLNMKRKVHD
jgi:hypothetical protein